MTPDDADSPDSGESGLSPSTSTSSTEMMTLSVRRRPIPRKGHTKSRRGCYNCKRRKVKCQETLPACSHCTRIGLQCEYPDGRSRPSLALTSALCSSASPEWSSLVTVSSPSPALQSTPTLFTGSDMRFFHHFLITAYPPLPMQGDDIWRNVAVLSHNVCSLNCRP